MRIVARSIYKDIPVRNAIVGTEHGALVPLRANDLFRRDLPFGKRRTRGRKMRDQLFVKIPSYAV